MRISDWSSDVCSSDLLIHAVDQRPVEIEEEGIAYHRAGPRHAIPLLRRGCSAEVGDEILRLSGDGVNARSEEHTSALQALMRNSYTVFCLTKINNTQLLCRHLIQQKYNKSQEA